MKSRSSAIENNDTEPKKVSNLETDYNAVEWCVV